MNLRGVIDYIRNFFGPVIPETSRKRRAEDPMDSMMLNSKCRRIRSSFSRDILDVDENFPNLMASRRSSMLKSSRNNRIDTVVLDDDDDDIIEIKKPKETRLQSNARMSKFTSTPTNDVRTRYSNGLSEEDEITFVKEIKSPDDKKHEYSKIGLNYIKPFSGVYFKSKLLKNGTKPREKSTLVNSVRKKANSCQDSLNYSIRLDDKMKYKKLLETNKNSFQNSSIYQTPVGKLFNYDTSNRAGKILSMATNSPLDNSKERMSTKDRIKKVLDDFEADAVIIKDSDSESDVILLTPPSPKPDFEVEPVNSFKKVVDTSEQTKPDWLDQMVARHKNNVEQRQKEIEVLRECSEKHGKINKDMRLELLTDKINKALLIKDAVLPITEEEEEVELPPLTKAQMKIVDRAFRGDPNEILARKFNLNITRRDLLTLVGLNWLNDEVINFYMNLIIERGKDSRWPKAYAFNTFFYSKLMKDGAQSLRRWTKKIDLFGYDLVCVPIHLGMHWCMAVIDFRDRSIRYYDSMGSNNNQCLDALRKYLEAEHLDKKKTSYNTSDFVLENVKDIPQQMNGSDCGMFACTFAEFLTRNAKITFSQEQMPYLRKKMVVEIISGELLIQ